jgi:hypothetical protein
MEKIGEDGALGKETKFLIDDANTALARRVRRIDRHLGAIKEDRAAVRPDDAGQYLHQRRLAGAVLADDSVNGAALDLDVHVGKRDDAAIALGEVADRNERLGQIGLHRQRAIF